MNTFKCLFILLTIIGYGHLQAAHNFDLVNAHPEYPIYVQANGGPWQVLDKEHYRYPITVAENNLLIMSLSANEDKSAAINILFSPDKVRDAVQQVGIKTTSTPTFYVEAAVIPGKVLGSTKTINKIKLAPQKGEGNSNKTKSGLSLENNVTQSMIDAIVPITEQEQAEPTEPKESATSTVPAQPSQEEITPKTEQPKEELAAQEKKVTQDVPIKGKRRSTKRHSTNRKSIV